MIYFYNHDYQKALALLESTLSEFKTFKNSSLNLTDPQQNLFIKLLGNVCALNLFLNRFEEAKDASNEIISTVNLAKGDKKKSLHEGICHALFRFKNFEMLKEGYFQNLEDKYSGETLGCLYLILGLNRELLNDPQLAIIYYKKSYEVWQRLDDKLFLLLTCKHITSLAQELNISAENVEYSTMLKNIMSREEMKNISLDLLFKDFEKRLALAKEITNSLKRQEENLFTTSLTGRDSIRRADTTGRYNEPNILGEAFWKQALKLKLCSGLKSIESIRHDPKTKPAEKKQLDMATLQIKKTLVMLHDEQNPVVQEQLYSLKYTKDAIETVKATLNRIRTVILTNAYVEAWRKILLTSKRRKANMPTAIQIKAANEVATGALLTKINFKNGKKSPRYFRVFNDGSLRWCEKAEDLVNPKVYRSCQLLTVKGVLYGKVTDKFVKNARFLEDWLCIQLVLPKRTIDLYVPPDKINSWYIGLTEAVKKVNPHAYCLSVGKFLWRKLQLLGIYQINEHFYSQKQGKLYFRRFIPALFAFMKATRQATRLNTM